MQVFEEGEHTLIVAEDQRFVRLMGLIGLMVFAVITILLGIVSGSLVGSEVLGVWFLAVLCLILYVHSERWELNRLTGTATRTRRLLLVLPLRQHWPCAAVQRVEVRERVDSDGDIDRAIILYLPAGETVQIKRLGALGGDEVQTLAGMIRAAAEGAGRLTEPTAGGSAALRRGRQAPRLPE